MRFHRGPDGFELTIGRLLIGMWWDRQPRRGPTVHLDRRGLTLRTWPGAWIARLER